MQRYRGIILSEPLDQYIRVFFLGTGGPHVSNQAQHRYADLRQSAVAVVRYQTVA